MAFEAQPQGYRHFLNTTPEQDAGFNTGQGQVKDEFVVA